MHLPKGNGSKPSENLDRTVVLSGHTTAHVPEKYRLPYSPQQTSIMPALREVGGLPLLHLHLWQRFGGLQGLDLDFRGPRIPGRSSCSFAG